MEVFGPVPSRRLGQSLGINHIPPKTCSYACIYCQLGQTQNMSVSRNIYTEPEMLRRQVEQKLGQVRASGQTVDYLTFVPDGEPTLDSRLGQAICQLKVYKTPIAVISNASLIWREDVQEELSAADWVSLKIDAATERLWKRINRPHRSLKLPEILNGIEQFAHRYSGNLVTETMLVAGYNDEPEQVEAIARQIGRIRPKTAYLLVPTRPPAEAYVRKPTLERLRMVGRTIAAIADVPASIMDQDENAEDFFFGQNVLIDLLQTLAVHPVREDVMRILITERGLDPIVLTRLMEQKLILSSVYDGRTYYRKNIQADQARLLAVERHENG